MVLIPCYGIKSIRKKIFQFRSVYFALYWSITFNLLTIIFGIMAWEEALTNLKLLDANVFEKATGIFSYAYGWILPYWGLLTVIVSVVIAWVMRFIFRKKFNKVNQDKIIVK